MKSNTFGIVLKTKKKWLSNSVELISSMRFSISLLVIISISSIIGTVVNQNEPTINYVNQFGPFWAEFFAYFSVFSVYSSWWFLIIMTFLVFSTSFCVFRNSPKILRDVRSWKENVKENSLRNFQHCFEWHSKTDANLLLEKVSSLIRLKGYSLKILNQNKNILVLAKKGSANKMGYIFAHLAIVIICIGGLLDSSLPISMQLWFLNKEPFIGNGIISQIPKKNRLSIKNPTFRGSAFVSEGSTVNTAIIQSGEGVMVQDLPFSILLERFNIDFYTTGMPKLFASEVIITDHETGESFPSVIKVNKPLIYKGYSVYQSSFEDGGSLLKLIGYPMKGSSKKEFKIEGEVGSSSSFESSENLNYNVEWTGFRLLNVENTVDNGQDLRAVNQSLSFNEKFSLEFEKRLGSSVNLEKNKNLTNIGPSIQYKLRDKNGQAREFNNYMLPVLINGHNFFLAGVRNTPSENFKFLRIPVDNKNTIEEWMRIRAALENKNFIEKAALRYSNKVYIDNENSLNLRNQLYNSALKSINVFIGNEIESGYVAISKFISELPESQKEKATEVLIKILNGTLWELWQISRESDGLPPAEANEKNGRFLQLSLNALADSFLYDAPVLFQLSGFDEIKASVFQVTKSPGKFIVYAGCIFLVVGIFSMLYINQRRIWILIKNNKNQTETNLMAMSSPRRNLDFEKEFESFKKDLRM